MVVAPIGSVGREAVTALALPAQENSSRLPVARPVRQVVPASAAPTDPVLRGASGRQIQAYAAAFAAAATAATVIPAPLPTPRTPRVAPIAPVFGIARIDVYA